MNVALVFGGQSTEHEISLLSAKNVFNNLDKKKFNVLPVFISKQGGWYLADAKQLADGNIIPSPGQQVHYIFGENSFSFYTAENPHFIIRSDVFFPVLHGPHGEDGTIQGFFEMAGIPYVAPGVLGSSAAMDKDITKKLLIRAGIDVINYFAFHKKDKDKINLEEIVGTLGLPLVVKPANAGSSIGISIASNTKELEKAIETAFSFDLKILVEQYVKAREIEVAVLGNDEPVASLPGEIISEFYDYKEKYSSESKTELKAPAENLDEKMTGSLQTAAIRAFQALELYGMARVDFFVVEDKIFINEINTIPGFTNISMYPKLFELSGIPQSELMERLIHHALEQHRAKSELQSTL